MKATKTLALTLLVGLASSLSGQGFLGESYGEASLGYAKLKEGNFRPDGWGLGAAVNFPALDVAQGVGIDFRLDAGYVRLSEGGASARALGAGLTVPFFIETGPGIRPFLAPNGGVVRARSGGVRDTSGFIGLTGGVELEVSPEIYVTPTIDYNYDTDDSVKTWSYGIEGAYNFAPQYALFLGYEYSDVRRAGSGYTIFGGMRMRF